MSDLSPVLALPYLLASQAQKHVTHNEALRILDVLVQTVVLNRDLTVPPASPAEGDRHIVAPGATGVWAGQDDTIAVFVTDHWEFQTPQPGWTAHVLAENSQATHTGSGWAVTAELPLRVAQLGVSSTPDATNRLSVSSPATLLNHAGAGHQLKLNKAASGDTASLLYQTGFSGRAEMGTAASDDFAIRVSADGTSFNTGLTIEAATAKVSLPAGALVADGTAAAPGIAFGGDSDTGLFRAGANQIGFAAGGVQRADLSATALTVNVPLAGTAVTQTTTDATAGRLLKVGDSATVLSASPALRATYGGSANAVTLTSGAGISGTPPTGLRLRFRATAVNTAATTIALDGGSAIACRTISGVALPADYVRIGEETWAYFDGTYWVVDREIERGSNANGDYNRFADGTQICWHRVTVSSLAISTAYYGGFRSGGQSWTYPAVFSVAPAPIFFSENASALSAVAHGAPGATIGYWAVTSITTQTAADRRVCMIASGRWY